MAQTEQQIEQFLSRSENEIVKKYSAMVRAAGERYGWGVVISAFPYVNGLMALTAALFCFLLYFICNMFGVIPGAPGDTSNPIGWILYILIVTCFAWAQWSFMACYLVFPLGAAISTLDMLASRRKNDADRYQGAVAGLVMSILPIAVYLWDSHNRYDSMLLGMMSLLRAHGFHGF